jgi:hypothetical protein
MTHVGIDAKPRSPNHAAMAATTATTERTRASKSKKSRGGGFSSVAMSHSYRKASTGSSTVLDERAAF